MEFQFKFTDIVFIARLCSLGFAPEILFSMFWFGFNDDVILLWSGFISVFAYIIVAAWPRNYLKLKYARIVMLIFCIAGILSIGTKIYFYISMGEWISIMIGIFFIVPFFIIFYEMITFEIVYDNTAPNNVLNGERQTAPPP